MIPDSAGTACDSQVFAFQAILPRINAKSEHAYVIFVPERIVDLSVFAEQLGGLLDSAPLVDQILVLAPADLDGNLTELTSNERLLRRLSKIVPARSPRLVLVQGDGSWEGLDFIDDREPITQQGLAALFVMRTGLLVAPEGYHFGKPSEWHSKSFIRVSNLMVRASAAKFVAVALLPWLGERRPRTILVDTAAIATVAHAAAVLRRRLGVASDEVVVDSFEGYEGLRSAEVPAPPDACVLISATTSGGLAMVVSEALKVGVERIIHLYSVGDITDTLHILSRPTSEHHPALVATFDSWPASACPECESGSTVLALAGDSFVPMSAPVVPSTLTVMDSTTHLQDLTRDLVATGALQFAKSTSSDAPVVLEVGIDISEVLAREDLKKKVLARAERAAGPRLDTILTIDDSDSRSLGAFIADELAHHLRRAPVVVGVAEFLGKGGSDQEGEILVVAATLNSGRSLVNASRAIRRAAPDRTVAYLVAVARPRDLATWKKLESDVTFGRRPSEFKFEVVWGPIESAQTAFEHSSWAQESLMLVEFEASGASDVLSPAAADVLAARVEELGRLAAGDEFWRVSDSATFRLTPGFAYWRHRKYDPQSVTAADVLFTISSVMQRARLVGEATKTVRSGVYAQHVLDPANFDRFNDSLIRVCLLRCAADRELHFGDADLMSRAMADLLVSASAAHHRARETGESEPEAEPLLEYLIGLCLGSWSSRGVGITLKRHHLQEVMSACDAHSNDPRVEVALAVLRWAQAKPAEA